MLNKITNCIPDFPGHRKVSKGRQWAQKEICLFVILNRSGGNPWTLANFCAVERKEHFVGSTSYRLVLATKHISLVAHSGRKVNTSQ